MIFSSRPPLRRLIYRPQYRTEQTISPNMILSVTLFLLLVSAVPVPAQTIKMPRAVRNPLSIDNASDPILALEERRMPLPQFRDYIQSAMASNAAIAGAGYGRAEQAAAVSEARSARLPTIDLAISANRAIARNFSNDPDSIIERARGSGRVDATATAQQVLFDFGATGRRIKAATARTEAAEADEQRVIEAEALRAIGAWYDVVAFGQMVELTRAFVEGQDLVMSALNQRIAQGVSAPVDRARVQSAKANGETQLASFQRQFGNAKARFRLSFGAEPPRALGLAPAAVTKELSLESVLSNAESAASVRTAEAIARASQDDAKAARADTRPNLSIGLEAGKYGLLEAGRNDYDVRVRLALRQRLLGPGKARADQASARANASFSRALTAKADAVREAETAWSENEGLRESLAAQRADYLAARITRDATIERFRVSRGTLFDVLSAEQSFFNAAATYIRLLSEYDASGYVLLARTGGLLPALGLDRPKAGLAR